MHRVRYDRLVATQLTGKAAPSGYLARGGHGVEFYAYDAQITGRVADFIVPAFDAGEAVVIIATREHRAALEQELVARGFDVASARRTGTYVALDAAETVAKLIDDGVPSGARFAAVVGGVIADALARGATHVRAYGEMVALLWLAGRPDAAIVLEHLWNDLGREGTFTLLCGYPISAFRPSQAAAIAELGRTHSQIAPIGPRLRASAI